MIMSPLMVTNAAEALFQELQTALGKICHILYTHVGLINSRALSPEVLYSELATYDLKAANCSRRVNHTDASGE